MHHRVDVVGHVTLIALTTRVVLAWQLVQQFGVLDQIAELEHEQPRPPLVGEQHRERFGLLQHGLELAHCRRRC